MSSDPSEDERDVDRTEVVARLTVAVKRWAYAAVSAREMSSAMLTRRLTDKATRRFPDLAPATREAAVAAAVAACVGHGFIDDARFAEMSIRGGVARGQSRRRIALKLKEKGVADAEGLAAVDDLAGALRLLRRRRLGPWVPAAEPQRLSEPEIGSDVDLSAEADEAAPARGFGRRPIGRRLVARPEDKAMALLLRNGFALETARRAFALTLDEAEARLDGGTRDDDA